ncbi:hypothetical protein KIPB_009240 [Kipferlia bialata]|uniref:Uncharacterized protein n=1 Tax=Kipferlia bialata TaxID=797122 RepID=A0A9K3D1Z7_9EUKA|nr:hypothetical protein KIPB_009240 [Kipferlia bialata]|eukprot:g9240.t1
MQDLLGLSVRVSRLEELGFWPGKGCAVARLSPTSLLVLGRQSARETEYPPCCILTLMDTEDDTDSPPTTKTHPNISIDLEALQCPIPTDRAGFTATVVGPCVYVFGGRDKASGHHNQMYILDPGARLWTTVPLPPESEYLCDCKPGVCCECATYPPQRSDHCAWPMGDRYLCITGGHGPSTYYRDMWVYDTQHVPIVPTVPTVPTVHGWTRPPHVAPHSMSGSVHGVVAEGEGEGEGEGVCHIIGGSQTVFTGCIGSGHFTLSAKAGWHRMPNPGLTTLHGAFLSTQRHIILIGGDVHSSSLSVYDTVSGEWTRGADRGRVPTKLRDCKGCMLSPTLGIVVGEGVAIVIRVEEHEAE